MEMEHDELAPQPMPAEPADTVPAEQADPAPAPAANQPDPAAGANTGSALSGLYDRLPNIPIKALDVFIGICVAAFIAVVVVGFVQGHS